jgi:hypothetical protein
MEVYMREKYKYEKQDEEIANISISINYKGQFVCDITGKFDSAKQLASSIIIYARDCLNKSPLYKNKIIFNGEEIDLLH